MGPSGDSEDDAHMNDANNLMYSALNYTNQQHEFGNISQAYMNSIDSMGHGPHHVSSFNNSDGGLPPITLSAKEKAEKERKATKKLMKELAVCKTVLEEMEVRIVMDASLD